MNFQQAEQFLLSLSNLPRRQYMADPKKCDVYLKRLQFFLDILGNPEKKIPHCVHIAGTSGKGSVASYIHAILVADKKSSVLYTSPHPTSILERWIYNDKQMTEEEFTGLISIMQDALNKYIQTSPYDPPSFFEITTAMTFYWCALKKTEWLVLETGCGGRYDSTNIMPRKDIAVITNIGLDHMEILGDTKEKIAYEKAGIIHSSATAITQEQNKRVRAVLEKEAQKQRVPLFVSKPTHTVVYSGLEGSDFIYKDAYFHTSVLGEHQIKNAILALDAARLLGISEEAIQLGIARAVQPMRMQLYGARPHVILDGAHNPDKIKTTVQTIESFKNAPATGLKKQKKTRIKLAAYPNIASSHLILAFSENKDIRSMIKELAKLNPASVMCTRNTVNYFRKVALPNDIAKLCRQYMPKAKIEIFIDPRDALRSAQKLAKKHDLILATGSLFMSGELRQYLTV